MPFEKPKKAVILAGGAGRRLLPYTMTVPKAMMPVGNRPILEVIFRQLQKAGVEELILATGHLDEVIRAYFGDGERFGVRVHYSREEEPLGTAGPLRLVRHLLDEPFLLVNGDILTDLDFGELAEFHHTQGHAVTVALSNRTQAVDFGVVKLDSAGKFHEWSEKPVFEFLVSTGIYVMSPAALDQMPDGPFVNLPDFIVWLKERGLAIGGYVHKGYWLDIGRREDYEQACRDAESLCLW